MSFSNSGQNFDAIDPSDQMRQQQQTNQNQNNSFKILGFKLNLSEFLYKCRHSRKLVLLVVFIALFFDNMLLTTIVPIMPEYLYNLDHPNETLEVQNAHTYVLQKYGNNSNNVDLSKVISMQTTTIPYPIGNTKDEFKKPISTYYNSMKKLNKHNNDGDENDDEAGSEQNDSVNEQTSTPETTKTMKQSISLENFKEKWKNAQMNRLNTKVGLMFASKPVVQLITNPFIGPLTNRIGYSIPMFAGFAIMFISTLTFAFSESFALLFIARAIQGVGSACSSVAGLGMLADRYTDDRERGNAMGIALGGLAMGVLIGPPFGGVVYQYLGKEAPFIILASLGIIDGALQLLILNPGIHAEPQEGASLKTLIKDPYILTAAGAITFANMGIAIMEPSLPIWMMNTMNPKKWELGAAFLPASISYLIGTNLFGPIAHKMGRWLCCMVGLIVIGISLILVPFAKSIYGLIIPNSGLGFAIGMVDSAMMPTMGYLVDIRHSSVYGSVYAIADVAFCLGFAIGPAFSGFIVTELGFRSMLIIIGILSFLYAPLMLLLKNPPSKEEKMSLVANDHSQQVKYVKYNNSGATSDFEDY